MRKIYFLGIAYIKVNVNSQWNDKKCKLIKISKETTSYFCKANIYTYIYKEINLTSYFPHCFLFLLKFLKGQIFINRSILGSTNKKLCQFKINPGTKPNFKCRLSSRVAIWSQCIIDTDNWRVWKKFRYSCLCTCR